MISSHSNEVKSIETLNCKTRQMNKQQLNETNLLPCQTNYRTWKRKNI